jgi:cell wall-associated NlpC family hydrolase
VIDGVLPDPRRHVYRADLAAASLRGRVTAPRYVIGEERQLTLPVRPLRKEPRFDAGLDSEALFGETVTVYDESEGWAWVQLARDGHVGYMPSEGLASQILGPSHRVTALRTYVHPEPDIKSPPRAILSLNSLVTATAAQGRFLALADGGFIFAGHAAPMGEIAPDYVAVAEAFGGTPYLWGGRTSFGVDCSGLVQLALEAAGLSCPRDSDMQAAELGRLVEEGQGALQRGDLVFWPDHVGIMLDATRLLHANAHHMATAVEPLAMAAERIAKTGSPVLCVRRLQDLSVR